MRVVALRVTTLLVTTLSLTSCSYGFGELTPGFMRFDAGPVDAPSTVDPRNRLDPAWECNPVSDIGCVFACLCKVRLHLFNKLLQDGRIVADFVNKLLCEQPDGRKPTVVLESPLNLLACLL